MNLFAWLKKPSIDERIAVAVNSALEQRATAREPSDWFMEWMMGGDSAAATHSRALKVATFWACVRNISEDTAKVPLVTYKRLARGKEKASEHPVYPLMHDAPNPEQSAFDWRSTMTQYALMHGNGIAEIVLDKSGAPAYLTEPLDPHSVEPKRIRGALYYEVSNGDGSKTLLSQDRVFHLKGMGDGIWGYSVIQYAKQVINGASGSDEFSNALVKNGLNAEGVLEHPGKLGAQAQENLRKSLKAIHSGAEKAGGTLILEEGMKYNKLTINPHDAQFIESKNFTALDICRFFRMPPHKVADLSRATFSNIEQQSIEYVTDTLVPWFVRWEQEISRKLLRPSERKVYFAEHVVNGLLRGDAAARSTFYREQWNIGAMSANDIRELENQNPIEGGDTYFVPLNTIPLEKALLQPIPGTETTPNSPEPDADDDMQRFAPHIELLTAAYQRLLTIEADRAKNTAKRTAFYEQHRAHVRQAIAPLCEAVAAVLDAKYRQNGLIHAAVEETVVEHVARSANELGADGGADLWADGTRAKEQAVETVKRIIKVSKHG